MVAELVGAAESAWAGVPCTELVVPAMEANITADAQAHELFHR